MGLEVAEELLMWPGGACGGVVVVGVGDSGGAEAENAVGLEVAEELLMWFGGACGGVVAVGVWVPVVLEEAGGVGIVDNLVVL